MEPQRTQRRKRTRRGKNCNGLRLETAVPGYGPGSVGIILDCDHGHSIIRKQLAVLWRFLCASAPLRFRGRVVEGLGRSWRASTRRFTGDRSKTAKASGAEQAQLVHRHKPFERVLDFDRPPFAKVVVGGRTNLCYNAVDRHLAARGGQKALVYISTETDEEKNLYVSTATCGGEPFRCRDAQPGRRKRRPNHHLHADDRGSLRRDAGLCPHRRYRLGRVAASLRTAWLRASTTRGPSSSSPPTPACVPARPSPTSICWTRPSDSPVSRQRR